MKNTGDLFSQICSMENLRKAHKNAKRGKGWYKTGRSKPRVLSEKVTGKSYRA